MAAVTSPQNRFARPRNKPERSFLHHWNKRQIRPSGNALTAVKQTGGHVTATRGGVCGCEGRAQLFSTLCCPETSWLCPLMPQHWALQTGTGLHCSTGWELVRIALKCFPKGIWETVMSGSGCKSGLFLTLYLLNKMSFLVLCSHSFQNKGIWTTY